MGYPILHNGRAVVGHRFQTSFRTYTVRGSSVVTNQIRMARKSFLDATWLEWRSKRRAEVDDATWRAAWESVLETRCVAEKEHEYLLRNRIRDEYSYAEYFGLTWPDVTRRGTEYFGGHMCAW
jgi:hypothetical protein